MFRTKKAQIIGMTLSNLTMFFLIFLILLGLVFFTYMIYAGNFFSKDAIYFDKLNKNNKYSFENSNLLFQLLEINLNNNESLKEKLIRLQLDEDGEFELSEKDILIIRDTIEESNKNYWNFQIKGKKNIILCDLDSNSLKIDTIDVVSNKVYLYGLENKIEIILDLQK
jgi:hypothetical protein